MMEQVNHSSGRDNSVLQDIESRPRSTEPAEGDAGTPPPGKGSPTPADGGSGKADDDVAHKDRSDGNPLAPPVNIDAGS
ncbi:hypothetical protein [Sphingobium sp.]|uniref:hypothetical protein n=1 Tax=Sphingobium sp. TaxID=1912891 RepID=UPI002C571A5B|nr:hypothetical protein [Sphingobium sp.]HUD95330.1 hypothetical protein [Sphingobium sp.]